MSQVNNEHVKGKKAAIASALRQDEEETNLEENEIELSVGDEGLELAPYSKFKLKKWKPVPPVTPPEEESPGEMGLLLFDKTSKTFAFRNQISLMNARTMRSGAALGE